MQYYYHEQLTDLDDSGFGLVHMTHPASYTPPHWHRPVELFYFIAGSASIRIDGHLDELAPGDLYLFNSYAIHESWFSDDAAYLCVHILPSSMTRYVPDFEQLRFTLSVETQEQSAARSRLRAAMSELLLLEQEQPRGCLLRRQSLFYELVRLLVCHFSTDFSSVRDNRQRKEIARIEPLLEQIELRHAEDLTLDQAADTLGFSREYFCRFFKRCMGVSYLQYLNQVRVAAACREIEISDEPIGVIVERHGLHNLRLFYNVFRQLYGCTPTEKRRRIEESGKAE